MSDRCSTEIVAVDIGNSRMKIGLIARAPVDEQAQGGDLPLPTITLDLTIDHATGRFDTEQLTNWCKQLNRSIDWFVASVHRGAADELGRFIEQWNLQANLACAFHRITYLDAPNAIRVEEPGRVGIDRLMAAVAANGIRQKNRAAIVADLGSAITVDLVDESGAFCGGAILPGIAMSARALHEYTDALPRVAMDHLEHPPAVVGKSTIPAIEAGLYWGAVGAVRELVSQMSKSLSLEPEVFITGGASVHVAKLLEGIGVHLVRHEPYLVLSGIALVAR